MPAQWIEQPFLWNGAYGYEYIPFTGLYHVGAREYDPRTARWLQRDPIGVAGGHPNVYLYCGNDPANYADPMGTSPLFLATATVTLLEYLKSHSGIAANLIGGILFGFGVGLDYALSCQNKPTRTGHVRLGRPNPSARYGWERSFAIDVDRYTSNPHLNADFGPLKRLNHTNVPAWMHTLSTTRTLRNVARGTIVIGIALDAVDIATAEPCHRGRAIGGAIGGAIGSAVGATIGSMLVPGLGTWIGGTIGGLVGSALGQYIGSQFDPPPTTQRQRRR